MSVLEHKFNNDLLVRAEDRALASRAFPATFYVLDHEQLRRFFLLYDGPANSAKRRSHLAGLVSIGMATLSLGAAAAAPLYESGGYARLITTGAAVLGLFSILIGVLGLLSG